MPETTDDTERFAVNRLDILMRTYKLSGTLEGSSSLLISALAHHLSVQYPIKNDKDLENACESVKKELAKYLSEFISEKNRF